MIIAIEKNAYEKREKESKLVWSRFCMIPNGHRSYRFDTQSSVYTFRIDLRWADVVVQVLNMFASIRNQRIKESNYGGTKICGCEMNHFAELLQMGICKW